jgi:hypothetical protein
MITQQNKARLVLIASVVLSTAIGCARYEITTDSQLADLDRTTIPTIILAPPMFTMAHRPYEVFKYTTDLLEVLTLEGPIPLIAPWEYDPTGELSRTSRANAFVAILDGTRADVREALVLDFRVDEVMTNRAVSVPAHMGGGIERDYQSDITITLSLRTFPRDVEVANVTLFFSDNPLDARATMANPRPMLRDGIGESARQLLALIERAWPPPEGGLPDVDTLYNPNGIFTYRGGAGDPLEADFEEMDDLDRMIARRPYYQYFHPGIPTSTMDFFEEMAPGLLVTRVGDSAVGLDLLRNDYITAVGGEPVAGIHSLYRPFLTGSPGDSVEVTLDRSGESLTVDVPIRPWAD